MKNSLKPSISIHNCHIHKIFHCVYFYFAGLDYSLWNYLRISGVVA